MKLIRLLPVLCCFLCFQSPATVYVDSYLSLSGATVGAVVTTNILGAGTVPVAGGYHLYVDTSPRVEVSSHSSFTIGAHGIDDSHLTQAGGVNQPTTQGQKCLAFAHTRPGGYMYLEKDIPSGHRKIQVCGWIKPGMNIGGANNYYDLVTIKPVTGGGNGCYMQIQAASARSINIETTFGGTTHSSFVTLQNQWYWFVFRADFTGGTTDLYMYNTDGAQVVNLTRSTLGTDGDVSVIRLGNGENGDAGGTTLFQDVGWDYTYNDYIPRPNAGLIMPPERMADWTNAGFTIPNVSTVFTTVAAGSTPATVQSAINSCPSNQAVVLAAGTYNWDTKIDLTPGNSGVVLRGTKSNGTNASIVNWSDTRAVRIIIFDEASMATDANVTVNIRKGTNSITLASVPTWCQVGKTIGLDMLNDETISSTNTCREGANIYRNKTVTGGNGLRGQAELVFVTATNATTVTVAHMIMHDYPTTRTPQIFMPGYKVTDSPVKMCGIEDITFNGQAGGALADARCLSIINGYHCWITGIESHFSRSLHIFSEGAYQCVYRSNYLNQAMTYANSGQGYGITFYEWSTRNLIENNIVRHCGCNVQFNYGSSGNVAAYNYFLDAHSSTADGPEISIHGNSADYNLFEGNYGDGKARFDCVHGSSFGNTLFRNRMAGKVDSEITGSYGDTWDSVSGTNPNNQIACDIDYWNHDVTILGNVFGTTGFHTNRIVQAPAGGSSLQRNVYTFGYQNAYGYVQTCSDALPRLNYTLHNNWDPVTAGIAYDATITNHALPNSYYLTAKPSWFGSNAWPWCSPSQPNLYPTNMPAGYRYVFGVAPAAGSDTNPPSITFTNPTVAGTYSTNNGTNIVFGGTAGDNSTVASVTVAMTGATNSSFTASGTTNWSFTSSLPTNVTTVVVTASDGQNIASDTLIVTVTPSPDIIAPVVTITQPTLSPFWSTTAAGFFPAGTAIDAVGVTNVTWSNALTTATGTATYDGSNAFSTASITLSNGQNNIIIKGFDAGGNIGQDTINVLYTPTSGSGGAARVTNLRVQQ